MFLIILTLIVSLVLGIPLSTLPHLTDNTKGQKTDYNFFFFFGNSYTNTAFDPTGAQPSPSNPLGNNGLSASDSDLAGGPGWATDLTYMFNSTPTLTYDFAYNCATVDASIVAPCSSAIRTIVDQVTEFEQVLGKGSQYDTFYQQNTLFAVWIGINDAHLTANNANILDNDIDNIMEKAADRYMEKLDDLYEYGARNFMLLNVPPFDRTPQITPAAAPRQRLAIKSLNSHLDLSYHSWKLSHPGIKSLLINTAPIFNEALDEPGKIGERNSTCDVVSSGPDAGCVWQDDFHPGVNMHRWIAEKIDEKARGVWGEFFR